MKAKHFPHAPIAAIKLLFYSNFLPFDGKPMADVFSSSHLMRMRTISRCVRWMSILGMVFVTGILVAFWSDAEWVRCVVRRDWNMEKATLQLGVGARAAAFLINIPALLLTLAAFWQVWQLFGCYERGEIFSAPATRHLSRLGQAILATAPVMPVTQCLTILALTLQNPPGQRILQFQVGSTHYLQLLFGLILLAMAMVMQEAQRMAEENAEFI
ncbi:MAG: DUF2975 domain-containing protein [Burkholderiaceae bacterium]